MTTHFTGILRSIAFAATASLLGSVGASSEGFTPEQRSACTPDALSGPVQRNPERSVAQI